jgi:hypothetical protein
MARRFFLDLGATFPIIFLRDLQPVKEPDFV